MPTIQKNLISVSQLTKDNNVFMEFHPSCCFVKDKVTGKVVLKGILKDGLYVLQSSDPSNKPVQFQCSLTSKHFLHNSVSDTQSSSHLDINKSVFFTSAGSSSEHSMCNSASVNTNPKFSASENLCSSCINVHC